MIKDASSSRYQINPSFFLWKIELNFFAYMLMNNMIACNNLFASSVLRKPYSRHDSINNGDSLYRKDVTQIND